MKYIVFYFLILVTNYTQAQTGFYNVGMTQDYARQSLIKDGFKIKEHLSEDGTMMVYQFEVPLLEVAYALYFRNNVCFQTVLFPWNTKSRNRFINSLNTGIVINEREWRQYIKDQTYKITLEYISSKDHFALIYKLL